MGQFLPVGNNRSLSLSGPIVFTYFILHHGVCRMAADYKLKLIYKKEFHEVFLENQEDPEFHSLMVKMKVMDTNGESSMDEAQWEAASAFLFFLFFPCSTMISFLLGLDIYIAFAFEKTK